MDQEQARRTTCIDSGEAESELKSEEKNPAHGQEQTLYLSRAEIIVSPRAAAPARPKLDQTSVRQGGALCTRRMPGYCLKRRRRRRRRRSLKIATITSSCHQYVNFSASDNRADNDADRRRRRRRERQKKKKRPARMPSVRLVMQPEEASAAPTVQL